jgi:hypothetical protein
MSEGWFCKIGEKKVGPLSVQQLRAIVARGQLRPEHMVRRGDDGPWVPAGRVKGLFRDQPSDGAAAKPAQNKPVARPANLPTAQAAPNPPAKEAAKPAAQAAAAPPAADLPAEFTLGSAGGHHKHHVALNVDKLHIDAAPVMVSTRKTKGIHGLKKGEQQKLNRILLGIIGGGLLVAVVAFIVAFARGPSSATPQETKQDEANSEETQTAKNPGQSEGKLAPKDEKWTLFPLPIHLKKIDVALLEDPPPARTAPPKDSSVDAGKQVLLLTMKLNVKLLLTDKTDKIEFTGWDEGAQKNISLVDDTNKKYRLLDTVIKFKEPDTISPGNPVLVQLLFEPPTKKVRYLHLALPASPLGEEGMLRFEIRGNRLPAPVADNADDTPSKSKTPAKGKVPAGKKAPAAAVKPPAKTAVKKKPSPAPPAPAVAQAQQPPRKQTQESMEMDNVIGQQPERRGEVQDDSKFKIQSNRPPPPKQEGFDINDEK